MTDGLYTLQENTLDAMARVAINFKKSPKARLSKSYVQIKVDTLDQYWESFRNTHMEILKLVKKEHIKKDAYFVEDLFSKGEEEYTMAKCYMLEVMESLEPSVSVDSKHRETYKTQDVKLPKINIPQFSGNYDDWGTFKDLYTSLIHCNMSLSNVQKLHYLKTSVTGEAAMLLKNITIMEKNYDLAWNTLKQRYNNKRIIINNILNRFFGQKKLSSESAKGIKDLLDTTKECISSLKNLDISVENWDPLVIYIIVNKLDIESHKYWEEEINELPVEELPTLDMILNFLEKRFRVLEVMQSSSSNSRNVAAKTFYTSSETKSTVCVFCKKDHLIFNCKEFANLSVEKRSALVQDQRLCFNCLWPGHSVKDCRHQTRCRRCNKKHHSLLHRQIASEVKQDDVLPAPSTSSTESSNELEHTILSHVSTQNQVSLLATAIVNIHTGKGLQAVRALVDPCSQESFITEIAAKKLQLKCKFVQGEVKGVGKMSTPIRHAAEIELTSRTNDSFKMKFTTYVIKQITDTMPVSKINSHTQWEHLSNLKLADPTYNTPGQIDLLLGVNVYTEIMMTGLIKGEPGSPVAQQTQLGWILSGGVFGTQSHITTFVSMHTSVNLDQMIQRFWEVENLNENQYTLTPLESKAEEIYTSTVTRDNTGKYIVALPFEKDTPELPENSKQIALRRLKSLEKRLNTNEKLRNEYNKVLQEYISLKHMEPIDDENTDVRGVYLPHHAVVREDKETTKVRVVYDASCKGTNNVSLNDELLVGPPIQKELRDVLMRWRLHKTCFIADIEKMYRQILVRKEDTDYQRILFRFHPQDEIRSYRLLTVTFGTACAPYLAIKTLRQVALDEARDGKYNLARNIVLNDFYMDDVLSGHDKEETAIEMAKQLSSLLELGGFHLQKWYSNSENFMKEIDPHRMIIEKEINMYGTSKGSVGTLGIQWMIQDDKLHVSQRKFNLFSKDQLLTKRNVLSQIASLFDPMGWLAPAVIIAKIFMQRLWLRKLDWDEQIPGELESEWFKFSSEIPMLSELSIERWIGYTKKNIIELHGFSDASLMAYAAVIYARIVDDETGIIKTSLVVAKTRVAPVKQLSLPRLELCAAVLLIKLLKHTCATLEIPVSQAFAWSDSQIVLAWINGDPNRWVPFVKNRVIETRSTDIPWFYVRSKENPADVASRGIMPRQMKECHLWWSGPNFLKRSDFKLTVVDIPDTHTEERKLVKCVLLNTIVNNSQHEVLTLLKKYSSLQKLLHVVAYCRRWLHVLKKKYTN